jgi:exosortase
MAPPSAAVPPSARAAFRAAWAAVAAGGVALAWWLARFWGTNPAYADRVLIPLAAAWLLRRRADDLRALPPSPSSLGLLPIVAAAALTPAAWYLAAQAGPVPLLLWWLAGAWLVVVAGLVLVQFGPRHLRAVAFPLAFLLFTLPPPVRVQSAVQAPLQEATTSCAAAVLPRLGVPVERSGFVLRLPSGDLGVVEACSGVRSVSAIVAVAALVAFVRGLGAVRGLLLTLLALPVVAAANAVRVILSGVLLEAVGPWVNEGVAHEALGVVTLLAGLAGVLALSSCLRPGGGRRTGVRGRD